MGDSWMAFFWFSAGMALGAAGGASWLAVLHSLRARWICRKCSLRAYNPTSTEVRDGLCKVCDRISELAT